MLPHRLRGLAGLAGAVLGAVVGGGDGAGAGGSFGAWYRAARPPTAKRRIRTSRVRFHIPYRSPGVADLFARAEMIWRLQAGSGHGPDTGSSEDRTEGSPVDLGYPQLRTKLGNSGCENRLRVGSSIEVGTSSLSVVPRLVLARPKAPPTAAPSDRTSARAGGGSKSLWVLRKMTPTGQADAKTVVKKFILRSKLVHLLEPARERPQRDPP